MHNNSNNYPMDREQLVPLQNNSGFGELLGVSRTVSRMSFFVVSACRDLDTATSLLYSQPLILIDLY